MRDREKSKAPLHIRMPGKPEIERAYLFHDVLAQCVINEYFFNSLLFRASLNPAVSTMELMELEKNHDSAAR